MDIGQLKYERARHEKLNLERTVSHMYDLPRSRRRCSRSCSWYPGTWSSKSSRQVVVVGQLSSAVARRPVDRRISPLPTSAKPHDLLTDFIDRPPVTNFLHYHDTQVTTPPTTNTISTAKA